MNKQGLNPFLPSYEYVPDGEPYVFGDRVYIYGSHDRFNGRYFCLNDYICWSAPVDNLKDWKYEGVIYRKNQDPSNRRGWYHLFAPDVTEGTDGRYYLYYAFDFLGIMSVAVSESPAGPYAFYGHIRYADGRVWGETSGDVFAFDPGVLMDDDGRVYLYTGFAPKKALPSIVTGFKKFSMKGGYVLELEPDMLTIKYGPELIIPKVGQAEGTGFEGHEFFEASSIRRIGKQYYFVYSSVHNHELCYAISNRPTGDFRYGGTLVSNGDLFLNGIYEEEHARNYIGNNHGGMVEINGQWYVFYHRQTNRHSYSRQACAEPITIEEDGSIRQVEMTSCGLNGKPLSGYGRYETYIACNLMKASGTARVDKLFSRWELRKHPYFTQEGKDREHSPNQYIANFRSGSIAGFKYFDIRGVTKIAVEVRGKAVGQFIVTTSLNGQEPAAVIDVVSSKQRSSFTADIRLENGKQALYFHFQGKGVPDFIAFELIL
ncbi:family 43 glycosylhydrolase [Paenibacillus brevis]|uniref:Family 43 glycosylhydrolase n=1 Tax=Paenibacillus brevis TaxID=2841508 RepID=A0ABS6FMH7_9BACL|nr:family 43 glycosylhydrolase [Paenibacillus brevis]MBU5671405.1 family 43 glycosylhydrolase [Paenibacillus brevis]